LTQLLINKPYGGVGGTPPRALLILLGMRSVSDKFAEEVKKLGSTIYVQ